MTRKTFEEKQIEVAEQHFAGELEAMGDEETNDLLFLMGGVRAISNLATELDSQAIRKLQLIRDRHLHLRVKDEDGNLFKRFDDFLDKWRGSPMSYDTFNSREKLLMTEGDEVFNLLNTVRLPMLKRRYLGKGSLCVEGDDAVVTLKDEKGTTEEQRIPLIDRKLLLNVLSRVADQNNERGRTVERGRKEVEVLKRKLDERPTKDAEDEDLTPYNKLRLKAQSALARLAMHVRTLPKAERLALREGIFAVLTPQWDDLNAACLYQTHAPDDKDFGFAAILTDDELDLAEREM